MPSINSVLRILLAVFLVLPKTAATTWDPNYHPHRHGSKFPKDGRDWPLPDWPTRLPDWLSANLTCYPTYDYIRDAHAINVLYVANQFCHELFAESRDHGRRNQTWPIYMVKRYDTNRYYQVSEGSSQDNMIRVRIQDAGMSCTPRWGGEGIPAGENPDGFATPTMPDRNETRDYIDVLHPYGGALDTRDTRDVQVYVNLCVQILYNTWGQCEHNEGRGGELTVEVGCLKYSIEPYEAQNYVDKSCPDRCVCPLYEDWFAKNATRVEKTTEYMIPGTVDWVNLPDGMPSHP